MRYLILFFSSVFIFNSCSPETEVKEKEPEFISETTSISTLFDQDSFNDSKHLELLAELRICNPETQDSVINGVFPCSPRFFAFYSFNHNRKMEDAFLLQVRKGVNNYPYRRLLIFTREKGLLVKMNGANGYLVEKRSQPNGIDDLVVAIVDNIGGHYERYDVLLKYRDGKYHYVEALGDLHGVFEEGSELKAEATKQIGERIKQKQLLF